MPLPIHCRICGQSPPAAVLVSDKRGVKNICKRCSNLQRRNAYWNKNEYRTRFRNRPQLEALNADVYSALPEGTYKLIYKRKQKPVGLISIKDGLVFIKTGYEEYTVYEDAIHVPKYLACRGLYISYEETPLPDTGFRVGPVKYAQDIIHTADVQKAIDLYKQRPV